MDLFETQFQDGVRCVSPCVMHLNPMQALYPDLGHFINVRIDTAAKIVLMAVSEADFVIVPTPGLVPD